MDDASVILTANAQLETVFKNCNFFIAARIKNKKRPPKSVNYAHVNNFMKDVQTSQRSSAGTSPTAAGKTLS